MGPVGGDGAMRVPRGLDRHPHGGAAVTARRQLPAPQKRPHSHAATPPARSWTPAPGPWLPEVPSPQCLGGDGIFIAPQDSRFNDMPHPTRTAREFGVLKEQGLGATANTASFRQLRALREPTWAPDPGCPGLPAG